MVGRAMAHEAVNSWAHCGAACLSPVPRKGHSPKTVTEVMATVVTHVLAGVVNIGGSATRRIEEAPPWSMLQLYYQ